MLRALRSFSADFHFVLSLGAGRAQGGLVTMVRKRLVSSADDIVSKVLVAGRVMRVTLTNNVSKYEQAHWNVHWEDVSSSEASSVLKLLRKDARLARTRPLNFGILASGDFNALAPGEGVVDVKHPETAVSYDSLAYFRLTVARSPSRSLAASFLHRGNRVDQRRRRTPPRET